MLLINPWTAQPVLSVYQSRKLGVFSNQRQNSTDINLTEINTRIQQHCSQYGPLRAEFLSTWRDLRTGLQLEKRGCHKHSLSARSAFDSLTPYISSSSPCTLYTQFVKASFYVFQDGVVSIVVMVIPSFVTSFVGIFLSLQMYLRLSGFLWCQNFFCGLV
jgi:hypothetical protein